MKFDKNPFWKGKKFLKDKFIKHINRRNPRVKIKLVVERSDGKKIELPVSKYVLFQLADFQYYDGDNFERVKDDMYNFWWACEFLEHDVVCQGICLEYNPKTKKWDKKKEKHYLYKKPVWK